MYPLDYGFDIWKVAYRSLEKDAPIKEQDSDGTPIYPPLIYFTWQGFFDLKASAFLALTAHYRSAIQLLRPIIENIIVARYFQEQICHAKDDDKEWKEKYENFLGWSEREEHKYGFNKCLASLKSMNIIKNEEEKRLKGELWKKLNKYLHPYMFRWDKGNTPEVVCYNEDSFMEWLDMYQNILSYMIEMLYLYFPEAIKNQEGQSALSCLKEMESLERECGQNLIKSKYLRDFLSQIPS